ncbi:MAG: maleylacetate reductase [Solirubrobacteraceae bacterium]|jgi:alcohol dehydrogenase class IV|nr:maleylacetate reductase [Solirubrobacteraceae bacterium]
MPAADPFTWHDGERTIVFGRGAVARAPEHLQGPYVLLTTPRAEAMAPDVVAGALAVHHVAPGRVDELAAGLLEPLGDHDGLVVALGGGRVIDTAKAVAAARPGRTSAAIPTTLSAAEMTRGHRHATGVDPSTPRARPVLVVNDPALCASQPEAELAASAANALGHAIEGPCTPFASPVPGLAAREAIRLTAGAWTGDGPDRDALALASLLSGYTIDATHYGLHHVLSQTLVRLAGAGHGQANAAMLPHTSAALRRRAPGVLAAADAAAGGPVEALAAALAERTGAGRLREQGIDAADLDRCADAATERAELDLTPPRADHDELRSLYEAAW